MFSDSRRLRFKTVAAFLFLLGNDEETVCRTCAFGTVSLSSSSSQTRESLRAPNKHSPRTCTAGSVAPSSARCALVEDDSALLPQYRSQEG